MTQPGGPGARAPGPVPAPDRMDRLLRISHRTNQLVTLLCVACFAAMLSITFYGTSYQLLTGNALSWTYSLARQFVPWLGLLSITVAFKHADHIAVNMLVARLPGGMRVLLERTVVASVFLFAVLMIWQGARFWYESTQLVMISDQIQISQRWVAASVPVMGVVMLVHALTGRRLFEEPADEKTSPDDVPAARQHQGHSDEVASP